MPSASVWLVVYLKDERERVGDLSSTSINLKIIVIVIFFSGLFFYAHGEELQVCHLIVCHEEAANREQWSP